MTTPEQEAGLHRRLAVELFNLVWELLDRKDRSTLDDDRMIHAAHASRYHWGEVGTTLEAARGEWQISRVYSVLRMGESALHHARRSLGICELGGHGGFDRAFALEAVARAFSVTGDAEGCSRYVGLAREAGAAIAEEDDREYFLGELATIPCARPAQDDMRPGEEGI